MYFEFALVIMMSLQIWDLLGLLAVTALITLLIMRKAGIWVALGIGILVCLLIGIGDLFTGNPFFKWDLFRKIMIAAVLGGTLFVIFAKLFKVSFRGKQV